MAYLVESGGSHSPMCGKLSARWKNSSTARTGPDERIPYLRFRRVDPRRIRSFVADYRVRGCRRAVGARVPNCESAATPATLPWSFAIDRFSRPFAHPGVIAATGAAPRAAPLAGGGMERWMPLIWTAGAIAVLAHWVAQWARVRRMVGRMSPVTEARVPAIAEISG
jgi:hypothetical protein